ncbi:unannotated protein [freshwater metagenome]|uniref:serine-type D-Ala-D-Ala carboxypeptidase n=1 Tax=freshwater metagenome TaxID=449393 RepID=A0A6J7IM02_9ZZZZ|nr:hypothetical protein [Actinomycetota bacterium]
MAALAGPGAASAAAPPQLSASAAILVQPQTGDVVYARRASAPRLIASTTKMMTALLALEERQLSYRMRVVPYRSIVGESLVGLRPGERWTTADLVRGLLLASGGDAAQTIAVDVGGSEKRFVRLMNRRARAAGLTGTHFGNPVGVDSPPNRSTPADLAKLALLLRAEPFARKVMARPSAVLRSGGRTISVTNRNTLVGAVPWVDGVKTGHTRTAGYVLVGSGTRSGVDLVSVVMGEPSEAARNRDTVALMNWGFARYVSRTPVVAGRTVARVPVKGRPDTAVESLRTLSVVVRRGVRLRTRLVGIPDELEGPLTAGTRVGRVEVLRGGIVVARAPVVTSADVAAASWWSRSRSTVVPAALLIGGGAALAGAATLALRRRVSRSARPRRTRNR